MSLFFNSLCQTNSHQYTCIIIILDNEKFKTHTTHLIWIFGKGLKTSTDKNQTPINCREASMEIGSAIKSCQNKAQVFVSLSETKQDKVHFFVQDCPQPDRLSPPGSRRK